MSLNTRPLFEPLRSKRRGGKQKMAKRLVAPLGVLLLAANLSAGDPWKDKSYKQWDEKDVRKILLNSPWVKEVRVSAPWQGAGDRGISTPAPSGGGGYGEGASGGMPVVGGRTGEGRGEAEQAGSPQAIFIVRWVSSRTVRQAMARGAVLRGTPEAQAEQIVAREMPEYVVAVLGRDMTPFGKVDEKGLKEKSYVVVRRTKAKFAPSSVEVQRARLPSGQPQATGEAAILAVVFYFSRKTATGEPALAADEKSVEFVCEAGGAQIKTNFELQKMAGPQGPDW